MLQNIYVVFENCYLTVVKSVDVSIFLLTSEFSDLAVNSALRNKENTNFVGN